MLMLLAGRLTGSGDNMRLIIEHSALAAAAWLSFDLLFVIAWARLHTAVRHSQHSIKATVIEFRPADWVRSPSNANRLASRRPQIRYGN
jgi:hypothetical protein